MEGCKRVKVSRQNVQKGKNMIRPGTKRQARGLLALGEVHLALEQASRALRPGPFPNMCIKRFPLSFGFGTPTQDYKYFLNVISVGWSILKAAKA